MKPSCASRSSGRASWARPTRTPTARRGHFYDLPYRLRRTLLCGRDAASLAAMAERWGWEETATDWRAAIDRKDIDVVDIALPNHLHAPAAIAAAEAGKIVLCEKPLALSVEEARAMVDAARGVPTLVWFNYRRVPGDRLRAPADRRRPARARSSTTTPPTSSSGAPTPSRPPRGTWIRRRRDPASPTIC